MSECARTLERLNLVMCAPGDSSDWGGAEVVRSGHALLASASLVADDLLVDAKLDIAVTECALKNAFGGRPALQTLHGGELLAAARGAALAGRRVVGFVSPSALRGDLLRQVVANGLPITLCCLDHGASSATELDGAIGMAEASGWQTGFACSAKHAIDLLFGSVRLAEERRRPALIAWDGSQDIAAIRLPRAPLVTRLLGAPAERIAVENDLDRARFGVQRRRLLRLFDADQPLLVGNDRNGARLASRSRWALGETTEGEQVAEPWQPLSSGAKSAAVVLVARGRIAERCQQLFAGDKRVAVVGVTRWLDTGSLERLRHAERIWVIERGTALSHQLAGALGERRGAGLFSRAKRQQVGQAHFVDVPGRAALEALINAEPGPLPLLLDEWQSKQTDYPKREQLRQTLQRVAAVGSLPKRAADPSADDGLALLLPAEGLTAEGFGLAIGQALGRMLKRPACSMVDGDLERVAVGGDPLSAASVAVVEASSAGARAAIAGLRHGGAVLLCGASPRIDRAIERLAEQRKLELYVASSADGAWDELGFAFGALLALLQQRGLVEADARRAAAVLSEVRADLAEDRAVEAGFAALRRYDAPVAAPAMLPANLLPQSATGDAARPLTALDRLYGQQVQPAIEGGEPWLADPCLSWETLPQLSGLLSQRSAQSDPKPLPKLDAARCTACGDCYALCPEGALGPSVLSSSQLLDAAMSQAKAAGADPEPLRMLLKKLAQQFERTALKEQAPSAGELIDLAFSELTSKAKLPEDRAASMSAAAKSLGQAMSAVDLVRSARLYEQAADGKRLLFSLAVNADSCTGCGLCIEHCADDALVEVERSAEELDRAAASWRGFMGLPDADREAIAHVEAERGDARALTLSRHTRLSLAWGDDVEAGSSAKTALRLTLACAEAAGQTRHLALRQRVDALRDRYADVIKERLGQALPADDVSALTEGLERLGDTAQLSQLAATMEKRAKAGGLDADALLSISRTAERLAKLSFELTSGPTGLGRARYLLLIAEGRMLAGIAPFPFNPFSVPCVVERDGQPLALALGLVRAAQVQALEIWNLLTFAELLIERPREAATFQPLRDPSVLEAEQRALCPPLIVVGDADRLDWSTLTRAAGRGLPIKTVALADAAAALRPGHGGCLRPLQLLSQRLDAFVAQTSVGAIDHLVDAARRAFAYDGPAVLQVHTPSPRLHGVPIAESVRRAEVALAARAFPLFVSDPSGAESPLGALDLVGNDQPRSLWSDERELTPADWLAGEPALAARVMEPVAAGATSMTVAKLWTLEAARRTDKQPTVECAGKVFALSEPARRYVGQTIDDWRALQQLAGAAGIHAERLRAELAAELAAAHQAELDAVAAKWQGEVNEANSRVLAEAVTRVRGQLLRLAGYGEPRS